MVLALALFTAYLMGSIPFAKIFSARKGIDIQKAGSGNIGFANTLREVGWSTAWKVLVCDVLKAFLPVFTARHFIADNSILLVCLAAIAGHLYPVWLKFRGGKGIAVGLGTLLAISPAIGAAGLFIYALCFYATRKSAVASLIATYSIPMLGLLTKSRFTLYFLLLALIATWTHRVNIRLLLSGRRRR